MRPGGGKRQDRSDAATARAPERVDEPPRPTGSPSPRRIGRSSPSGPSKRPDDRAAKALGWTRSNLREMKPYYKAAVDGSPLRLDQNTNLHGSNPAIAAVDPSTLSLVDYPSRDADALMDALAHWHGLAPDNFLAANGSDEALDIITKTFTAPREMLASPWPSYSLYPFYAKLQDLKLERVPMRAGFRLDVDALLAKKAKLTIVANPNNPTGRRVRRGDLERLVAESTGIVVVDEAYIEYAGLRHSLVRRIEEFDNLIVMRTFSKAYGLAGLRIGYLVANRDLMARMRVVKPPFNLNTFSERVACLALEQQEWVDRGVRIVQQEREEVDASLRRRGFETVPSEANFILARSPLPPAELVDGLRRRGILVRHFPGAAMLDEYVRFGIGEPQHTSTLQQALKDVME